MKRSQQWITEHFEELVSKYGGKYVGVVGEQVIACAITLHFQHNFFDI